MNKKLFITLWILSTFLLFWCAWKSLSRDQIKSIVADYIWVETKDIRFLEVEKDLEDWMYDVEFIANGIEYSYEINPSNWEIIRNINVHSDLSKDNVDTRETTDNREIMDNRETTNTGLINNKWAVSNEKYLTQNQIKNIVANHAWIKIEDMKFFEIELDYEDVKYDVEFWANEVEYDYEVNAINGSIIKKGETYLKKSNDWKLIKNEIEYTPKKSDWIIRENVDQKSNQATANTQYLTREQVKSIVANYAWVKVDDIKFLQIELDHEEGKYDVEFVANWIEYDYEINAINGKLIYD